MSISPERKWFRLVLALLERETSCLWNTLILGTSTSWSTTAGGSAPNNLCLGQQCLVVVNGL